MAVLRRVCLFGVMVTGRTPMVCYELIPMPLRFLRKKSGSGDELTLAQMDDLVALLRRAPKPVLIHCLGGADRSGLAAALYGYAIEGEKPAEANRQLPLWYGHVPLIRPKVTARNDSFRRYVSNRVARATHRPSPDQHQPLNQH